MGDNPEQAVEQAAEHVEQAAAATQQAATHATNEADKGVLGQVTGILQGVEAQLKRFADYMDAAVAEEGEHLEQAAQAEAESEQPVIETPAAPERYIRRFGRKVKAKS